MIKEIRIERELFLENRSIDTFVELKNGRILSAYGIMGITQYEDRAPILIREDNMFRLPMFLWHHYFAVILTTEGGADTKLVFRDGGDSAELDFQDVGDLPRNIRVNEKAGFNVFLQKTNKTGRLSVSPDRAEAGSRTNFKLTYTAGETGLREGATVYILTPVSCWSSPYFDPAKHFIINAAGGAELRAEAGRMSPPHRGNIYKITVIKGGLREGESFAIDYTDEDGEGVAVQRYIQDKVYFLGLESGGDGIYTPLALSDCAPVKIISGGAKRFRIKTAQIITPGEELAIEIRALDICRNPVNDFCGETRLEIKASDSSLSESRCIKFDNGFCEVRPDGLPAGCYVVSVEGDGFERENLTLVVKEDKTDSLYFGEIHGHSEVSDGLFGMRDYFEYGKTIGMLDFCALSDHDWEIVEHSRNRENSGLKALGALTAEYNEPGRFVTFCGYEWMGVGGHINVYYLSDADNPVYVGMITILGNENLCPTMERFIRQYKGRNDALLIPHFSHGFDYNYYDARLEPVAEIYSQWGMSEQKCATADKKGAIQFLNDGLRFGFIAGADSHHGMPGQTGDNSKYSMLSHREGLTGVFAPGLTRGDIFSSIKAKKTYATTGERMLLDFKINGRGMGGEINLSESPEAEMLEADIFVGGTRPVEKIQIISRGSVIWEKVECGEIIEKLKFKLSRNAGENEYYYLKAIQSDGGIALSSPIWIN